MRQARAFDIESASSDEFGTAGHDLSRVRHAPRRNELYVTGKTAAGFIVCEAHDGRSTVTFDNRIVGMRSVKATQNMAMLSSVEARTVEAHVSPGGGAREARRARFDACRRVHGTIMRSSYAFGGVLPTARTPCAEGLIEF